MSYKMTKCTIFGTLYAGFRSCAWYAAFMVVMTVRNQLPHNKYCEKSKTKPFVIFVFFDIQLNNSLLRE